MEVKKRIIGRTITLEFIKIKDYPRYSLYQVYKHKNGSYIPLYQTCLDKIQLREIKRNGKWIVEEVFD